MAQENYIVNSGLTASASVGSTATVTLWHGSALVHCNSVADNGVDYKQLTQACPGAYAFCTSIEPKIAKGYALLNPLVRMSGHVPAIVRFDLPHDTVQYLLANKLTAWVLEDQAYEWLPGTFARINIERTNIAVLPVTENTITFDE